MGPGRSEATADACADAALGWGVGCAWRVEPSAFVVTAAGKQQAKPVWLVGWWVCSLSFSRSRFHPLIYRNISVTWLVIISILKFYNLILS